MKELLQKIVLIMHNFHKNMQESKIKNIQSDYGYHPEHCVSLNLSREQRSVCGQLRCGPVTSGGENWTQDRKCLLCDL